MSLLPDSRSRPTPFVCEKRPAVGSRGMAVTNHPLASAAAAEILLGGGNAIDATVAALFALTVVEPMMVGILGGGVSHIRLPDGRHVIIDNLSCAPKAARAKMYVPLSDGAASARDTKDRRNAVGASAVAVPGSLAGWTHMLAKYGTRPLHAVMRPAIRLAADGFTATSYLSECIGGMAADLSGDAGLTKLFLRDGKKIPAGTHVVQADYAATLRRIADEGPDVLYRRSLGKTIADYLQANGGTLSVDDLAAYAPIERTPVSTQYRGRTVIGPPPPASGGVHIAQMLNILEGFDVGAMGFGSPESIHLLAEILKIAFADRAVTTADPAFVKVPVERVISKAYASERRAEIDLQHARRFSTGRLNGVESSDTTHVTVADANGFVVSATHTINGLFGACVQIPGTGMIANNYMHNFDPHPGRVLSIVPGKRVFSSMAPMMVTDGGSVRLALGLPGALRIFPSAFQAIVNWIDHRMDVQEAVEAPRIWTEGTTLELEPAYSEATADALAKRGHTIQRMKHIAGGMNAIAFSGDGMMTGAACWRADGTPVGLAGGLARPGIRFETI
jgi:gamma-glutamyltranspeptidase / glutathione hydrolase